MRDIYTNEPLTCAEKQDGWMSYDLAVAAMRERGVRSGEFFPSSEAELRQQAEGPRENDQLDAIKADRERVDA